MSALLALARAAGIDAEYTSWRGVQTTSSDEALLHALRALGPALGFHIDRIEDAGIALVARERARWGEVVPPVVVGWDGDVVVPMSMPAETDGDWEIEITTESGRVVRAHGRLFALAAASHAWPGGVVHCVRTATIRLEGELGYHDVRWRVAGQQGTAFAIAAPMHAWGGPGQGTRRWGVFAPVYGLASEDTGSAGDLSTLRRVFEAVARRGGSYVATLPVLAAFLDEPCAISPYSPASRLYWNELYLDLGALAADVGVTAPLAPMPAPGDRIDYRAQYRWRRDALDAIAARMLADPARRAALDAWALEANVYDYAVFRAIGEQQHAGWRAWPAPFRDGLHEATSRHDAIGLGADRS
ncbi:MAG TPA: 4-alpha-glucanotransferase, partial [Kofleriaceae bacterium]|nr:4-alpha-glucanotransferase [Kofleriaceae bacterium]